MTETCMTDVEQFLDVVQQSGLLEAEELQSFRARRDLARDARGVATQMVREGILTKYQGNRLLEGKHHGFVVGTYKILQLLIEGKKDAIFLAWHGAMNRHVALKIIKQNQSDCKLTRQRFMREAQITASLNHAHIVKLFDIVEENGLHYLIMEYVEGSTLQQLVDQNGPMPVHQAVEYIRQAALGLNHAHQCSIIHRDIKPSNLILSNKGLVKILDMGHSRFSDDEKMNITEMYNPTAVVGTVDYFAPELAIGEEYTVCCDIYSLGATLFTLIAGRQPFQGTSYQILMSHQIDDVPALADFQPGVSARVQALVNKMMAKNPKSRFQSAQEVIDALTALQVNRSAPKVPKLLPPGSVVPAGTAKNSPASKPRIPVVTTSSKPGMVALNSNPEVMRTAKPTNAPKSKEIIRRASGGGVLPETRPAPKAKQESDGKAIFYATVFIIVAASCGIAYWLFR